MNGHGAGKEGTSASGTMSALASLAAIIGAALFNQSAHGSLQLYLPLHMLAAGSATVWIGAVSSAFAAGFLFGCFMAVRLVRQIGHIRTFSICAVSQATFTLALWLAPSPAAWSGIRFLMGIAGACVAVVYESWINERTAPAFRGHVFGLYNVLNRLSQIGGQLASAWLTLAGSFAAFGLIGLLFAISLVPVGLTRAVALTPPGVAWLPMRQIWRASPLGLAAALHAGLVGGVLIAMMPVYAQAQGFDAKTAALLAAAAQAGCLLTQWPLGAAVDRHGGLRVIGACAAVSASASLGLLAWQPGPSMAPGLSALAALLGGTVLPMYALSLTHASQFAIVGKGQGAVGLSSALLASWSAGSVVGPVVVALAMSFWGPSALAFCLALSSALLCACALKGACSASERCTETDCPARRRP